MTAHSDRYVPFRARLRAVALACAVVAIGAMAAGSARAERYVVVNGQRLSDGEIAYLEQLGCVPVPNGRYWLNTGNGVWGYAGDSRPQGYVGQYCNSNTPRPPRPGLSQRGMLFSPYDYVR